MLEIKAGQEERRKLEHGLAETSSSYSSSMGSYSQLAIFLSEAELNVLLDVVGRVLRWR
jgi:hypothetical protein